MRHAGHAHSVDGDNVDDVAAVLLHVLVEGLVHHVPSPVQVRLDNGMEALLTDVLSS